MKLEKDTYFWIQQYLNQERYLRLNRFGAKEIEVMESAMVQYKYFIYKATGCDRLPNEKQTCLTLGEAVIILSDNEVEAMNNIDSYVLDNPHLFK
jgi:hypothetical protein